MTRQYTAAFLAAIIVISICAPAEAKTVDDVGWRLEQKHLLLTQLHITMTKYAIRICNAGNTWGVVCKAPKWDAICWRDRTICTVPYAQWLKNGFPIAFSTNDEDAHPEKPTVFTGRFNGAPAIFMRWRGRSEQLGLRSESELRPKYSTFTFISMTEFSPPVPERQLLSRVLLVPESAGIPVSLVSSADRRTPHLETLAIKRGPIDAVSLAAPRNYRTVKESDIWLKTRDKEKIKDFAEMFGEQKK